MAISKRLRYEILRRDNHSCRYCGEHAPDVVLTVDHVVPKALGGSDDPSNLVAACKDCNSGKSASSPDAPIVDDVAADALRWARAMERAAEMQRADDERRRQRVASFDQVWSGYTWGDGNTVPRHADWSNSINAFFDAGLDGTELADAVEIAMGNRNVSVDDVWRYFCGICWRRLERRREMAAALIETEEQVPENAPQLPRDGDGGLSSLDEWLDRMFPARNPSEEEPADGA